MKELELYKLLLTTDNEYKNALAEEVRWELEESDKQLLVWVSYLWVKEFMESLKEIFGVGVFDDYGFKGVFQHDGICLDLEEILEGYGLDLEEVFPIEKFC